MTGTLAIASNPRLVFANNAATELAVGINGLASTLQLSDASRFPSPSPGQQFQATLEDRATGAREIVAVLARTGNQLAVLRGQEGTSALAFPAGAMVANRVTAYTLEYMLARLNTWGGLYLGAHALAPGVDLDGNPLRPGMIYYNLVSGSVFVFDPEIGWKVLVEPTPSAETSYIFILSDAANQVSGYDRDGQLLEFTGDDLLHCYVNGTRILPNTDFSRVGTDTVLIAATLPPGTTVEVVRVAIVYRDFITTAARVDTSAWLKDGSTIRFQLTDPQGLPLTPANAANCLLSVDGIMQEPELDYRIEGSEVVFVVAPGANATVWMSAGLPIATESGAIFAPLNSPAFVGVPTAPTAAPGTSTAQLATTAFAQAVLAGKANIASPAFTGTPTAPTPGTSDSTTKLATMAAVQAVAATRLGATNPAVDGQLTVSNSAGTARLRAGASDPFDATIELSNASGRNRDLIFMSSTLPRWIIRCDTSAESGGDVGSALTFMSRDDAGNAKGSLLTMFRSTSAIVIGNSASIAWNTAPSAGNHLANKTYVDGAISAAVDKTRESTKAAGYTLAAADSGAVHTCTVAMTVAVPSAATLGANFYAEIFNGAASGTVLLNGPGATDLSLAVREGAVIFTRNGVLYGNKFAAATAL